MREIESKTVIGPGELVQTTNSFSETREEMI